MRLNRHGSFDPGASKVNREGFANAQLFRCPCRGVMFDVTSLLAEAMGVLHYECDRCHTRAAYRPGQSTSAAS